jgi:hypothetical protein
VILTVMNKLAETMGAKTRHLETSHVPFVSRPQRTAALILDAVRSVKTGK